MASGGALVVPVLRFFWRCFSALIDGIRDGDDDGPSRRRQLRVFRVIVTGSWLCFPGLVLLELSGLVAVETTEVLWFAINSGCKALFVGSLMHSNAARVTRRPAPPRGP